jgi:hypothetical protein
MNIKQGSGFRLRSCCLAVGVALAASSPAQAVTFDWGDWSGSWDNTISYGISWRGEDRDPALVGLGNGGTSTTIATDDGNLNFDSGDIFSNIFKGTSELGVDNGQFGFFGRIKYWYDFELENGKVPHGHSPNKWQPGAELNDDDFANYAQFSGLELLDAFIYGSFELGAFPLDLRLGRQVVNWGEATFIQGVNVLNPIDVSAFRRPGAEIKEGLLPVSLFYLNLGLPAGFSFEAFYQFKWEETVIDACGTYFSNVDYPARGCNQLLVSSLAPDFIIQNLANVKKDPFVDEPDDSGQFGVALRNYVEAIDTEFGLYYQRLHNRTPVINVHYTPAAAAPGGSFLGPTTPVPGYYQIAYPEDIDIYGVSFATNVGVVALSGEVSLKQDMPVQINGSTELLGGLGAFNPAVCASGVPNMLVGPFGERACAGLFQLATTGDGLARGYDRFDVWQAQATALYFFEQALGAERLTLIGEVAWIGVDDLPAPSVMPYGRNPTFGVGASLGGTYGDKGFVTSNSWGYRVRAAADYPNVVAGIGLTPTIAWSHDVSGSSPTPTFTEDTKAFSLGLNANYLSKYRAGIAYTWFSGDRNALADRDFFSITVSMDF